MSRLTDKNPAFTYKKEVILRKFSIEKKKKEKKEVCLCMILTCRLAANCMGPLASFAYNAGFSSLISKTLVSNSSYCNKTISSRLIIKVLVLS